MIRDGDRKAPYRYYWISKQPDARITRVSSYLRGEWNEVNAAAVDARVGVSLLEGKNKEIGIVMPPDLLYLYHMNIPGEREYYPVAHVDSDAFKKDPGPSLEKLKDEISLVLLKDQKPSVAIGSRLFRNCELEIVDRDGRVDLAQRHKKEFFDEQGLLILFDYASAYKTEEEKARNLREVQRSFGTPNMTEAEYLKMLGLKENSMSAIDHKILDKVIDSLRDLRIRIPENYERVVRDLVIDVQAIAASVDSQSANQPTNEAG